MFMFMFMFVFKKLLLHSCISHFLQQVHLRVTMHAFVQR